MPTAVNMVPLRALRFPKSLLRLAPIAAAANFFPLLLGMLIGLFFGNVSENHRITAEQLFSHNFRLGMLLILGGWLTCGLVTLLLTVFSSIISGVAIGVNISTYGYLYVIGKLPHFLPETLGFIGFTTIGAAGIVLINNLIRARMAQKQFTIMATQLTAVLAASTILLSIAAILEEGAL